MQLGERARSFDEKVFLAPNEIDDVMQFDVVLSSLVSQCCTSEHHFNIEPDIYA